MGNLYLYLLLDYTFERYQRTRKSSNHFGIYEYSFKGKYWNFLLNLFKKLLKIKDIFKL